METEAAYPYTATSGNQCLFDPSKVVAKFNGYVNVTQFNEVALMSASSKYVISVGIDASQLSFQFYSSGVYYESACKSDYNDLDHGVTVVGYGTDPTSKLKYWIVKNSWGAFWQAQFHI